MKKQFLTLAILATVAVGGAFAGSVNQPARVQFASPTGQTAPCDIEVPCHPDPVANCRIGNIEYAGLQESTGLCTFSLALD